MGRGDIPTMLLPHTSTQLAPAPLRWAPSSPDKPALTYPPVACGAKASKHHPSPSTATGALARPQRQEQKQGCCARAGSLLAPCLTLCSLP